MISTVNTKYTSVTTVSMVICATLQGKMTSRELARNGGQLCQELVSVLLKNLAGVLAGFLPNSQKKTSSV